VFPEMVINDFSELPDGSRCMIFIHRYAAEEDDGNLPAVYIYPFGKIQEEKAAVFRRKKTAWYLRVVLILAVLRVIYAFAVFFMKITARHAGTVDTAGTRRRNDIQQT
jgi:hypothetical protein